MPGAVLNMELKVAGRRAWVYWTRWALAAWLVFQFLVLYLFSYLVPLGMTWLRPDTNHELAHEFLRGFIQTQVSQQLTLIALAVPVFTAGAITEDKVRGTLIGLLTSGLSPREIVVEKWLGRMCQVLALALTGVPLVLFAGGLGGFDVRLLAALPLITVAPALAYGAASMLASVWYRQTRDAVLALYLVVPLLVVAVRLLSFAETNLRPVAPPGTWAAAAAGGLGVVNGGLAAFDPYGLVELTGPGGLAAGFGQKFGWYLLSWGVLTAGCLQLAAVRLRPNYERELERGSGSGRARWYRPARPPVLDNPLLWKERYIDGLAPNAFLRSIPLWLGIVLVGTATAVAVLGILSSCLRDIGWSDLLGMIARGDWAGVAAARRGLTPSEGKFSALSAAVLFLATAAVMLRCSGTISGERERQTWESLLVSPLDAGKMVRSKLAGVLGATAPYLLTFYAVAGVGAALTGRLLAVFYVMCGTAFVWPAMLFVGSAGVFSSVKSGSSWRSLLYTLGLTYLGGSAVLGAGFAVAGLLIAIVFIFVVGGGVVPGESALWAGLVPVWVLAVEGLFCVGFSLFFLDWAGSWVSHTERSHTPTPRERRERSRRRRRHRDWER